MSGTLIVCICLAAAGLYIVVSTFDRARRADTDIEEFMPDLDLAGLDAQLVKPLPSRLAGMTLRAVSRRVERFLPRPYLDSLDRQLAQAGLAGKRKAGEQFSLQLGLALVGTLVLFLLLSTQPPPMLGLTLLLLPVIAFYYPSARLTRAIRTRSDKMFKDLPDIVDMLAIAVEAGSGFESALSLVCDHFDSPLTDDMSIALREMELGMSRREALQLMRDRTDLDAVRNLVLALVQADALGIPIGRVLKGQAAEVRAKRRAWARERAAKLPVKILFPLVLFVFPPIMALVLAPAVAGFTRIGG